MAQVLEVDSDLMGSASDRIALQQGTVSLLIVPYFPKQSFAVFYVTVFIVSLFLPLYLFQCCLLLYLHFFSLANMLLFLLFLRNIVLLLFLIGLLLRFLLYFRLSLLALFNLSYHLVDSIFMRNAFNIGR